MVLDPTQARLPLTPENTPPVDCAQLSIYTTGQAVCKSCNMFYAAPTSFPEHERLEMAKSWVLEHNTDHILG